MLTPLQSAFVWEYVRDRNGAGAYRRAGGSPASANVTAAQFLAIDTVKEAIASIDADRAANCALEVNDVLRMWAQIATADPNELVRVVVENCRHCHGKSFKFQWRDHLEWMEACTKAAEDHAKRHKSWQRRMNAGQASSDDEPLYEMPSCDGGFGFNSRLEPNLECPACEGHGKARDVIADTRKLTGAARRLYAGVKRTKDGVQILMRDQDAAAANVAKYLGMFIDRVQHGGTVGIVPLDEEAALTRLTDDELRTLLELRAKLDVSVPLVIENGT